jgi:outer membrane receptor protein involved in Fe transport
MQTTLTLKDSVAANRIFALRGSTAAGASYVETASSLSQPQVLVVNHKLVTSGSKGSDRHSVKVQLTQIDALGNPVVVTAELLLTIPRSLALSTAEVLDQPSMLVDYLSTAGYLADLVQGVTP